MNMGGLVTFGKEVSMFQFICSDAFLYAGWRSADQ